MGRFRDKEMLLYQGELRGYFYKRFGASAFWNYALLAEEISHFSFTNDHASVGAGLRFAIDRQKKINLRFDAAIPVGVGRNDVVYYFTINEAF